MGNKKQYFIVLALFIFIGMAIMSFQTQELRQQPRQRNLKVLPQNISRDSLHQLMDSYNTALGIKCNYCHAQRADDSTKLDFSSDAKPAKEEARFMMRMTNELNKKYFTDDSTKPASQQITCITCHNGKELPAR
jgi:hypothetical protein